MVAPSTGASQRRRLIDAANRKPGSRRNRLSSLSILLIASLLATRSSNDEAICAPAAVYSSSENDEAAPDELVRVETEDEERALPGSRIQLQPRDCADARFVRNLIRESLR